MPFDFNDFLALAEKLAAEADDASKRTSISRAYYTVYHLALPRAEANVGSWNRRRDLGRIQKHKEMSSHVWCWQQFIDTNDPACKQIGVDGDRMKLRRHTADYERKDIPNIDAVVQRQIIEAKQFRADIAALAANFPSPR